MRPPQFRLRRYRAGIAWRRRGLALTVAAASCALAVPAVASAAVVGTSITSPAPLTVVDAMPDAPGGTTTLRVEGRATVDGPTDNRVAVYAAPTLNLLDLVGGITPMVVVGDVTEDGTFSVALPSPGMNARIIAIPDTPNRDDVLWSAVNDPSSPFRSTTVLGGTFNDELDGPESKGLGFRAIRGQRYGYGAVAAVGASSAPTSIENMFSVGGITAGIVDPTQTYGGTTFLGTGLLPSYYNDSRGSVMIDGARGYLRDQIPLEADELPLPTVARTVDRSTGAQTVVQTQIVYVAANAAADPELQPLADGYKPSGLELQRTTVQDHDGQQFTVSDRFRSTDGTKHRIDLLYGEGIGTPFDGRLGCGGPCSAPTAMLLSGGSVRPMAEEPDPLQPKPPTFRIPWETGDRWAKRAHGDLLLAPPTSTSTVYTSSSDVIAAILGSLMTGEDPTGIPTAYGAITFGTRPDGGVFLYTPSLLNAFFEPDATSYFMARFVRDVPRDDATTITQVYSLGATEAKVAELAAAAERRLTPPTPPAPPAPPAGPPSAPPAPPAKQPTTRATPKRATPKRLSRTTRRLLARKGHKGEYRLRFRGTLALPKGVSRSTCRRGGTVTVQIKAGRNTISTRRAKLDRNCRYSIPVTFRSSKRFGKHKRLAAVVRWSGNRTLSAKRAKRLVIRVR